MAAYAVKADVQKKVDNTILVQLTDFAGSGTMDDAKITQALADATATVDAYTAGRYTLPLTVSDQVKKLCVDLAIYNLYEGRQLPMPVTVELARNNAVSFLKDVSAGRAQLDQATLTQSTEMDVKTPDRSAQDDKLSFSKGNVENF